MKTIKDILDEKTVNSIKKDITTINSSTDNSLTVAFRIEALLEEHGIKPEGVAQMLCEGLNDTDSKRYYTILASENSTGRLLEAMHLTKDAYNRGNIRTNKAIYFQGILRRWGLKTRFKKIKKGGDNYDKR